MRTLYSCSVVSSFFLLFFFPCLISATAEWMSTILLHMVWSYSANLECSSEMCCTKLAGNTGRKNDAKNRHLGTIAQICRAESSQLMHVSTIEKSLLSSNMFSTCLPQYGELRPTSGWDRFGSLGHPRKFQRLSHLGSVKLTARHSGIGRQPNFVALNRGRAAITLGIGPHFSSTYFLYCLTTWPIQKLP